MTEAQQRVVEQVDRDAAADLIDHRSWLISSGQPDWCTIDQKMFREGRKDNHYFVQAFAAYRHRLAQAAMPTPSAAPAGVRDVAAGTFDLLTGRPVEQWVADMAARPRQDLPLNHSQRTLVERVARAVGANREGNRAFHDGCEAIQRECQPLFVALGMTDDGDGGFGFADDDEARDLELKTVAELLADYRAFLDGMPPMQHAQAAWEAGHAWPDEEDFSRAADIVELIPIVAALTARPDDGQVTDGAKQAAMDWINRYLDGDAHPADHGELAKAFTAYAAGASTAAGGADREADRDRRMYEQGRRDERAGEPEAFI